MEMIKGTDSYFLEGTGTTVMESENGESSLVHLQSMNLDMSASTEKVYGGETNTPVFTYQSEKDGSLTMKNASLSMNMLADTQGVKVKKNMTVFEAEDVKVGADGEVPTTHTAVAGSLRVYDANDGSEIALTDGKVDVALAGKTVKAVYDYVAEGKSVGFEVLSTSIPGYVHIRYKSKAMKQKDGRAIRLVVDIPKARSDGSLKVDSEHKNAFAPEIKFDIVDPENGQPMVTVAYLDVTGEV